MDGIRKDLHSAQKTSVDWIYVEHLLGSRSHHDKHSTIIFIEFYQDKMDANLVVLGTLVCENVLI